MTESKSPGQLRIAVAEDILDELETLSTWLATRGFEVTVKARTASELIAACKESPPDLAIIDVLMPGGPNGIEAAQQILEEHFVPVILLTGVDDPELEERGAEVGNVFFFLKKPLEFEELERAIASTIRRSAQVRELISKYAKAAERCREELEDRKVVERAKEVIMTRGGVDGTEALRRIRKLGKDRAVKMVEVAKIVLTVEEMFKTTPQSSKESSESGGQSENAVEPTQPPKGTE